MKIELEIEEGMFDWEENSYVKLEQPSMSLVEIQANKEGLISLAKQLLTIAYCEDSDVQIWAEKHSGNGYCYGDLEEGSLDLSIAKVNRKGR